MRTSESSKQIRGKIVHYAAGIYALPIIPLYMLAYRLMGKRCTYRWGEADVRPVDHLTENQYLFTRLFPALVPLTVIGLIIIASYILGVPIEF